ncbi:MAG: Rrf2 family transcriptional regulator [Hydrogenophaga sp.]|jgi:Rrf2 family nitric oxide-sensitive transcriptional repressor|uniref:RrF2 family transcriptional regulator n=1 Tax=Hydrogenophaga sp. TaxID=1904254 RepID=UPI00271B5CB5|nr:Rrf2 family transcriptional regulator [Hydrogenophaga sp.]MDO9202388.1 Rrf2 family transcriptional regulator [Hydrogenophaga sp.]MDO9484130.1 Rrf2 family transcriptional regulator [Hydrogenophaga sp.]MDO9569600.1 Rrf2 family transcriptional regulator [Hydrogenophaga sp.]MDP1893845.1 Rrf2 family transcriptional regulator [Hydrogenophaga sp.]MDP3343094.1 Rrf2 family transcriptional regulator [Hydrogenophaga sp.]
MRLTQWTDYSLRVLMYCAACAQREKPATISEIAEAHGISRSHLTKIVMTLSGMGLLETTRGRGGGLRLLKPAQDIVLGDVVRQTETDFTLVECFDADHNTCRLDGHCRLKGALQQAMDSYLAVLDGVTLADLLEPMPTPGAGARKVVRVKHIPGLPGL